MPKTEAIGPCNQEWANAVVGLSIKHHSALIWLWQLGYEPIYRTFLGTYKVLGRTSTYEVMLAEGFSFDDNLKLWLRGGE